MRVLFAVTAMTCAVILAGCGTKPTVSPVTAARCHLAQQLLPAAETPPGSLTGVQFVTPERGWVVGASTILASADGGRHWVVQDRGRLRLGSVDFVDASHGWAVGASTVLATADGGSHWAALPEPCPAIRQVHFISARTGFAIAGGTQLMNVPPDPMAPLLGGVVLGTADGGRHWHRLAAPADAQSVCFNGPGSGWLGADGILYRTADGGRSWQRAGAGARPRDPHYPALMTVQCAGAGTVWALAIGPGAASSQQPHVGYHAGPTAPVAIFAEQYFEPPGGRIRTSSPGSYTGPVSAISPDIAAFIDWCPACGYGTVPWALAVSGGSALRREGDVGGLSFAAAASFLTPRLGWVVGNIVHHRPGARPRSSWRIVSTSDGGRSWNVEYTGQGNHSPG
jgi:photosystem II stability/assembly factor-like uncharacterized protein